MKKITVTREQQETINTMRRNNFDFENMKATTLNGQWVRSVQSDALNGMTDEQFSAAWFCAADIEPEPVEPWEAYRAYYEGKKVRYVDKNGARNSIRNNTYGHVGLAFSAIDIRANERKFYILEDES
ncbi:hypothetical protein [Alkalicoccus luteus]|uniref:Uncharacterized protein n=1 Tax=Alkalicoccus luteus TaxID=1237094 RepID=A0A969TX42_9BACI|nr:hypothetical protein [Alkalicoccus luteus]NJP37899.1 hypothetical protein [Alkalicoccus luteus]